MNFNFAVWMVPDTALTFVSIEALPLRPMTIYTFLGVFLTLALLYCLDTAFHKILAHSLRHKREQLWRWISGLHTILACIAAVLAVTLNFFDTTILNSNLIRLTVAFFFTIYISKAIGLLIGGLLQLPYWSKMALKIIHKRFRPLPVAHQPAMGSTMSRKAFLAKTTLLATSAPFATLNFGILNGVYDYQVHRLKIKLPNLPAAFKGFRLLQVSDIHVGGLYNKTAVTGGIEMALAEKPDLICFTGDLVNASPSEMREWVEVFSQLKAPLGTLAVLGNHDYGNYRKWHEWSAAFKAQKITQMEQVHQALGWQLLLNQNHLISQNKEHLAIVGIENWSANPRFPTYGHLSKALEETEQCANRILLSHDPSHWDAQIRPEFPEIDLTLSGHTHGMQFGIEIGDFRWSPVQYLYKQWAGLYQEGAQQIYVNRGFGYVGFPGRVGILPEITLLELV